MSTNEERVLNRTERLFALVLLLQNRPNMTSADLAAHFGVSRRTIFRDLRALGESGVPLTYAEGGGYEILEGYQLPPLMLSAREAATLLTGTRFMKLQRDPSLREDADQVALKILSVLPREVREYVERLLDRTVLDPFWINAERDQGDQDGRWYELSEAVARRMRVQMDYYVPSRDEVTRRKVDPLGLVYYTDHWNLIAFDHLRERIRNFRLDRIQKMHVTYEHFEEHEDFDLASYLDEQGEGVKSVPIRLRVEERVLRWLRRALPARVEEEVSNGNGTVDLLFYFENLEYVARRLLNYSDTVRVLEPDALRLLVQDEARRILAQYED